MGKKIIYAWVPGLPHLLRPELSENYKILSNACRELGVEFKKLGVERILYYSTQWLSVLGQSVQCRKVLEGSHVDENWHQFGPLPFHFYIDQTFSKLLMTETEKLNLQVRSIDYREFPVDTGTIVANQLINTSKINVSMYSSCVYSDYAETMNIGHLAREAALKMPGITAMVAVSGLSGRFFTSEIDFREDHIRDSNDDIWNRKILNELEQGHWTAIDQMRDEYCQTCKVDMGLKGLAFLGGAGGMEQKFKVHAYESIYGTGAAVLSSF